MFFDSVQTGALNGRRTACLRSAYKPSVSPFAGRLTFLVSTRKVSKRNDPDDAGWRCAPKPCCARILRGPLNSPAARAQTGKGSLSAKPCAHRRHQRGFMVSNISTDRVPCGRPSIAGLDGKGRRSRAKAGMPSVHRQAMDGLSMDPRQVREAQGTRAAGRTPGRAFFWCLFFARAKKRHSPQQGRNPKFRRTAQTTASQEQ